MREQSDTLVSEKNEWLFNISLQLFFVRLQCQDIFSKNGGPRAKVLTSPVIGLLPFHFCLFTSKPVPLVDVGPHNFHNAILPFYEISDPFTRSVQLNPVPHHLLQAGIFIGFASVHLAVYHNNNRFIPGPFECSNEFSGLF